LILKALLRDHKPTSRWAVRAKVIEVITMMVVPVLSCWIEV
jgi:hypothetical protein